jgi:replicative DNA helicase
MYFVLEGSALDIALRFDMRLTRVDREHLESRSKEVRDHILYVSNLFKSKLLIQQFPANSVTVRELDDYLTHKELADGFVADLLIVDYLALCKATNPKEDTWKGSNYREGKGMAGKRNKPLWSPVQAKMDSLKADVITPKAIAEATGRIWADSDVIIGLCQSEEEEKKEPMELRWYLGKHRNNRKGKLIPMIFDPSTMYMEEVEV